MKKIILAAMLLLTLFVKSESAENNSYVKIDISLSEDKSSLQIFLANTGPSNTYFLTHTIFKDYIFKLSDTKNNWNSFDIAKKRKASISGIIIFTRPQDIAVITIPTYEIQNLLSMKFSKDNTYSLSVLFKPANEQSRTIKFSLSSKEIEAIRQEGKTAWWKTDVIKLNNKFDHTQSILQLE